MAFVENQSEKHLRLLSDTSGQSGVVESAICGLQPADADDVLHSTLEHVGAGLNLSAHRAEAAVAWRPMPLHRDVRGAHPLLATV